MRRTAVKLARNFNGSTLPNTDAHTQPAFLYSSFVVMTTVGLGDIVPVTMLYSIAITISRLVSLYRSDEAARE